MDDKLKVFWNLDVLVKMCRSKSDGPSLRIEEEELNDKIILLKQEIEEIKSQLDEETYDTSAEMADRNIEIITKKHLQTLKTRLKDKNKELSLLKEEEKALYSKISLLRNNKNSQEKYIASMQERINEATDYEVIDRYNGLIAETTEAISSLVDELEEQTEAYEHIQESIIKTTEEITSIEDRIEKKKKLLEETQISLENKENYIDKSKKEKSDKKIFELEMKVQKATIRLEEIKKDPKYLESKIKEIINSKKDIETAKPYLVDLINTAIKVPYINVPADNSLEEELLKATQARDSFANEIEQKSYNILETNTPEKIRIEFLNERISLWNNELEDLKTQVDTIDRDKEYNYEARNKSLHEMLQSMQKDLREYEKAYREVPDINISAKASIKAAMDEKREDIIEAEKIVTAFKRDESEDIARATRTIKYECERLYKNIQLAEKEIDSIKNRLTSKKSGLIDIEAKNKDKDTLKELAQIVIDIKHRRQFPETPIEIVKRLEKELDLQLSSEIEYEQIVNSSDMIKKDYNDFSEKETKRGIKVVNEDIVDSSIEEEKTPEEAKIKESERELQSLIKNIERKENSNIKKKTEQLTIENEDNGDYEGGNSLNEVLEEINFEIENSKDNNQNSVDDISLVELEAPVTEDPTPIIVEISSEESPTIENIPSNITDTSIEEVNTIVDKHKKIVDAVTFTEQTPVVVETPNVEDNSAIEEQTIVITEPKKESEIPIVEEQISVNIDKKTEEESTIQEVATFSKDENHVKLQRPPMEDKTILSPKKTATFGDKETDIEELSVELPHQEAEDIEESIDEQIDKLVLKNNTTEDEDNQPLDIDAMFAETPASLENSKKDEKRLSIDTIFNVEINNKDSEENTNEKLVDDFNKYLNNLENKDV